MSDEEKTRFMPRNFGIAAKTVVMRFPPQMTMYKLPTAVASEVTAAPEAAAALAPTPTATNEVELEAPAVPAIAKRPSFDPRATRMLALSPPPVDQHRSLQRPPSCPEPAAFATAKNARSLRNRLQERGVRQVLMAVGVALVAALVLVLPLSSPSASSQSEAEPAPLAAPTPQAQAQKSEVQAQAQKPEVQAQAQKPEVQTQAQKPEVQTVSAAQLEIISEQKAAATLVSGHRAEALQMYRALAARDGSGPGVQAMVIVLSQKVEAQ